jgi:hypothetical protein
MSATVTTTEEVTAIVREVETTVTLTTDADLGNMVIAGTMTGIETQGTIALHLAVDMMTTVLAGMI